MLDYKIRKKVKAITEARMDVDELTKDEIKEMACEYRSLFSFYVVVSEVLVDTSKHHMSLDEGWRQIREMIKEV